METMKLIPNELLDKLIKKVLRKQGEMQIKEQLKELADGYGAHGRSMRLVVDKVGTYNFILDGSGMKYVEELRSPTTIAQMNENTFLDIYESKLSAWTAWKHNLVKFQANDNKALYHVSILLEIFNKMREIMGV